MKGMGRCGRGSGTRMSIMIRLSTSSPARLEQPADQPAQQIWALGSDTVQRGQAQFAHLFDIEGEGLETMQKKATRGRR